MEYGLFSKDAALKIDVQPGTMRQWCIAIEKEGYKFERNEKDQRIFYERDIKMLFELKTKLKKTRNRNNAIKSVVERYLFEMNANNTPSVQQEKRDNIVLAKDELQSMLNDAVEHGIKEALEQQKQFNKEISERLDQQAKAINKRDKDLLEGIRQLQESKKLELQAAATEEEKRNDKPWWKFWK
ncbi:hypothetical protein CR194_09310 [Salipaludibacillus keqinensis]|uniref:Uncharacterized protein n=1 Tax=Salipaludibacillus keqinensis TaxID=2045207 RepID=A0A323THH3_9BACI|nr:hypothetical protein [Salipaludibacillus keqinensis]PYZ93374.1 hypothetical protein CR194_09310 [Salipaludibacillus keqinensis]